MAMQDFMITRIASSPWKKSDFIPSHLTFIWRTKQQIKVVILPMIVISISNKMTSKMPGFQRKKFIK